MSNRPWAGVAGEAGGQSDSVFAGLAATGECSDRLLMDSKPLLIDSKLLAQAAAAAADSPRRRKNLNFHTPEHEGANRLLNAVEPGSYVQPHRHLDADKDETLI